jgi:hypothetical protein
VASVLADDAEAGAASDAGGADASGAAVAEGLLSAAYNAGHAASAVSTAKAILLTFKSLSKGSRTARHNEAKSVIGGG